jgi:superfamily II RNA helicase
LSEAPPEDSAPTLYDRIPRGGTRDTGEILDRFVEWMDDAGFDPYPHQEEAFIELMAGRHVVLNTPTGSGKSLVAIALHFKALCEGVRSFYTCPIKALASQKFFEFCDLFGAERVGMLTGDASINHDAPLICCTTEVLANMALREGASAPIAYVVLDEFHYFGDRERGVAWQIPLLLLTRTSFLLMSATLGNTAAIEEKLRAQTGREVACVYSEARPVPLDFEYRETPLHESIETLLDREQAPIYIVNFTQRQCAEQAQGLTSARITTREERAEIDRAIAGFKFDSPYGKDVKRYIRHGIGLHHAGLLPKYRLLVEQLAQRSLLKVICGTDTLGVGVNIPIRTVLFSQLFKFDGEKIGILSVREFKQIAGRAGRKGFDERGSVVCQAPEYAIENKRAAEKAAASGKKRKPGKKKPPAHNFVSWNRDTFQRLIHQPPETLISRFHVDHGIIVNVLQRGDAAPPSERGYRGVIELIDRSHERPASKARLRRHAARLFRSLRRAEIVEVVPGRDGRPEARVAEDLQFDFSLHHTLSPFLIDAVAVLDPESPNYALELLTLVESIIEDPRAILYAQIRKQKTELMAKLKTQRVPYEERIAKLERVTHPKPDADFVYAAFGIFVETHPWFSEEYIHLKSIAREMFEDLRSFDDYTREYAIARSEGLLLRYLNQVLGTLVKTVPEFAKSDEVYDAIAYFRTLIKRVDSSLIEAWETLADPTAAVEEAQAEPRRFDLAEQPELLAARARSELHALVRALSAGDYEAAAACVHQDADDLWDAERFERALAPYFEEYEAILFTPDARNSRRTLIKATRPRRWDVSQVLVDPEGDCIWAIEGAIDLSQRRDPEDPIVQVRRIGT